MESTELCRACLAGDKQTINILHHHDAINDSKLSDEYFICTNVIVTEDDQLPATICLDCMKDLISAYNFRLRCQKSELCLRDKLKLYLDLNQTNECVVITHESELQCKTVTLPHQINKLVDGSVIHVFNEHDVVVENEKDEALIESKEMITDDSMTYVVENIYDEHEIENEIFLENSVIDILGSDIDGAPIPKSPVSYPCTYCDNIYSNPTSLQKHKSVVHSIKFGNTKSEKSSVKPTNVEKSSNKKYTCSTCEKGFSTNQRLKIHLLTHTNEKNFACSICPKRFATELRLKSHLRIHTGERPYQCKICLMKFAQCNALKCHSRIHTGEKPYECKVCGKRFNQNTILKTHMTLHTGKTVECPDCDKKFSRASYLILHRREHTGEKPYACDRCPNRYRQKSHLDRHMDVHNGVKHKCNLCDKEYTKQWSLKVHMFNHSNSKPYKCTICGAEFGRKDKLKSHIKTMHNQDKDSKSQMTIETENEALHVS